MQTTSRFVLLLAGLCASGGAVAAGPTATAVFQVEDPVTHRRTTVVEARLDQHVCLSIQAELVPVGEHSMQVTIYDGQANEVGGYVRHKIWSDGPLRRDVCMSFEEDHDPEGTWWYVVELDDKPLISTSIEIRPKRD